MSHRRITDEELDWYSGGVYPQWQLLFAYGDIPALIKEMATELLVLRRENNYYEQLLEDKGICFKCGENPCECPPFG